MKKFFTADSHFSLDDESVISRDFRPFRSLKDMNREIINIWNSQSTSEDIIYHLGDFVNFNKRDNVHFEECFKLVQDLKSKVVLVCGNNEERIIQNVFDNDFDKFRDYLLGLGFFQVERYGLDVDINGKKFYLTHEPKNHKSGVETLFGHIHGTAFVKRYGFNVGIDNHYLAMFSENDITDLVSRRIYFDENVYD